MPVNTNIGEGANISKDTATEADVLDGLTFHAGKTQKQRTGTMTNKAGISQAADASLDTDNSLVQMKIPVTGKYNTSSYLYATYASVLALIGLTADMLKAGASVLDMEGTFSSGGTATEEDILEGKTASVDGEDVTGTMANKSGTTTSATASLDASNSRLRMKIPVTAKYDTSAYLYATYAAIRTLIGLTASVIATGTTILGVEGTYTGLGDASASDVLTGKTFSTASLSNASGTMADKTGTTQESDASLDSDNSRLRMKIPATGKYNTNSYLYATYSKIASLIGLTASVIATGTSILGIDGAYKGIGTATAAQVLSGYTFSSASLSGANGSMANKGGTTQEATASLDTTNSRLQLTIPATGYYNTSAKLYAAYSTIRTLIGLTAAKIATGNTILGLAGTYKGIGTAAAAQVLTGYTFSSASLSGADGSMPNLTSNTTITYTSDNATKVIVGDAAFASTNSDGTNRVAIRYNSSAGYISANTLFAIAYSTMTSAIGLTAAKLGYGKTCLGLTGTYKPTITQISATAACGFGVDSSGSELSEEDSYTCTAAGTCYYNGFAASEGERATVTCEIYKNGTLVDSRNIDSSNTYNWRGTMQEQSFSVVSGDVIKVKAAVTFTSSSYSKMSHIDATIVTYT